MNRSFDNEDDTRRDFLVLTTGAIATAGVGVAAWPFISSLNPAADVLATSTIDVDLEPIELGQRITVVWRSKPVFIDHRTAERIALAKADDNNPNLIDPAIDSDRVLREEWLIVIGICTHLGCIPLGQRPSDPRGEWVGWYCPCHGSQYDTSGRVRRRPAPRNLDLLPYRFLSDTLVRLG